MIASLPMYDMAHVQPANDRLWAAIRDRLRAAGMPAPDALTRSDDAWSHWQSPDLVLSQTCGLPYRSRLHGQVTLVGTPDYGLPDAPPGHYYSVLIARADDPRDSLAQFDGAALAYNGPDSQSGWAAPLNHAAKLGLRLRPALHTGAHRLSLAAVAEGRAEIAAIDAVSWRLFQGLPEAARVKVLGATDPTPGLPLIAAPGADGPAMFAIIAAAIAAMPDADRAATGLCGLVSIPAEAYLAVPTPVAA